MRKRKDWLLIATVIIAVGGAFAAGAYLAQKYATPCICVLATGHLS